jgi:hypothetical protein
LMKPAPTPKRRRIGFHVADEANSAGQASRKTTSKRAR